MTQQLDNVDDDEGDLGANDNNEMEMDFENDNLQADDNYS